MPADCNAGAGSAAGQVRPDCRTGSDRFAAVSGCCKSSNLLNVTLSTFPTPAHFNVARRGTRAELHLVFKMPQQFSGGHPVTHLKRSTSGSSLPTAAVGRKCVAQQEQHTASSTECSARGWLGQTSPGLFIVFRTRLGIFLIIAASVSRYQVVFPSAFRPNSQR